MVKAAILEKLLEIRQVLKLNVLMDMSPHLQFKELFKIQTFNSDKKTHNPICDIKKEKKCTLGKST